MLRKLLAVIIYGYPYAYTHTGQKNHIKKSANKLDSLHWDVPMRKQEFIGTLL